MVIENILIDAPVQDGGKTARVMVKLGWAELSGDTIALPNLPPVRTEVHVSNLLSITWAKPPTY